MSWRDRYLEQERAWRLKAQKLSAQGKESEAELARRCAMVYQRLADETVDITASNGKM